MADKAPGRDRVEAEAAGRQSSPARIHDARQEHLRHSYITLCIEGSQNGAPRTKESRCCALLGAVGEKVRRYSETSNMESNIFLGGGGVRTERSEVHLELHAGGRPGGGEESRSSHARVGAWGGLGSWAAGQAGCWAGQRNPRGRGRALDALHGAGVSGGPRCAPQAIDRRGRCSSLHVGEHRGIERN